MKKYFLFLFLSSTIVACAPATPELFLSDSSVAESSVSCKKDDYKKTEWCSSPWVLEFRTPYDNHKSDVDYYFTIARHLKKSEPYP